MDQTQAFGLEPQKGFQLRAAVMSIVRGEVPFQGSVPVWALRSCHGSDPSGEIRR